MISNIYATITIALTILSCVPENSDYSDSPRYGNNRVESNSIRRMLILGDSIATGVLIDTKIGDPLEPSFSGNTLSLELSKENTLNLDLNLLMAGENINNSYVVESINGLEQNYKKNPSAFFGGVDFPNDQVSLSAKLGLNSNRVINAAISGYRTSDVLNKALPDFTNQKKDDVDLVVLEIGANDFCSSLDPIELKSQFTENYSGILRKLSLIKSKPKVLIIPIPDIPNILSEASDRTALSVAVPPFTEGSVSCQELQQNYCPRFRDYGISEGVALASELNKIIEELVDKFNDDKDVRFKLVSGVAERNAFTSEMLSIDCFHFGDAGHRILSNLSYEAYMNFSSP